MSLTTPGRTNPRTALSWRTRRLPLVAVLAFLVTRVILLAHHHLQTDIRFYHQYYLRANAGGIPYRDIAVAYPPAAWWVIALPHASDWPTYRDRFRRAMAVLDIAAFALFTAMLFRRRPEYAGWACLAYVASTAALEHLLYDRLDVGLLFLLMLWAYTWWRDAEQEAAGRARPVWGVVAYFVLGFSVAYKLVPGVMLPFLVLSDLMTGRSFSALLGRSAAFAVGLTFPFLVHYPSAGLGTLAFLRYHVARGIQIESIYAVLLWMMSPFGLPLAVADLPETVELRGAAVPAMVRLSNFLSVTFVAALGARALWLRHRYGGEKAFVYSLVALSGLMLFAKGLSPQYFIWIVPLLILCGAAVLPPRAFMAECVLLTTVAALTTVVFPLGFGGLLDLDPSILFVLAVRNALFAAILLWLLAELYRNERRRGPERIAGNTR
jgi:hypothetical protein